ncbi:MAG TPA: DNA repair protein RecN [Caulobacteraceae bacterium]|nr:DNA repair protein RecN [Caulobacteraceae bacterium]
MLIGLGVRDVVLIESLGLAFGPGLTVLTGETGAGKSIILDALGLAIGRRAEPGLVRPGAAQASATAIFAPGPTHQVWSVLEEKGLGLARDEDLVLRRTLSGDGRSRGFVNDQAASLGVLRELGALLIETHGQHETVGLLDPATHRPLLDAFGALAAELGATSRTWSAWRTACERARTLAGEIDRSEDEAAELEHRLAELDRLDPREAEEAALAEERALLSGAEKTLADIAAAADHVKGGAVSQRLGQALRALERARARIAASGAGARTDAVRLVAEAVAALERALGEASEVEAAVDAAAAAFAFRPERLEQTEERLFALRAMARKLGVAADALPAVRTEIAERLRGRQSGAAALASAEQAAAAAHGAYLAAVASLGAARRASAERLTRLVQGELAPLKLDKARFRAWVEPLAEGRAGPAGADRVQLEVSTNPGAPFAPLGDIASGGELARFALALKVSLALGGEAQPAMIFDEVDQGVGGAVADAVGQRLKRLAAAAQVLVVTHSPQVAARADTHWRVIKAGDRPRVAVEVLGGAAREEEIARMLAGARITDAARAAARALMNA